MHRSATLRLASTLFLGAAVAFAWAAAPARADDDDKARKGFDFGGDDKPARPTKDSRKKGRSGRAGATDSGFRAGPVEEELAELRSWPDRKATRAAEKLFLRGTEVVPHLVRTLNEGDPAIQAGAAWVLGKVGEAAHVPIILRAAAKRPNASRASVFFKAAYGLDAEVTRRWLISFLTLSTKPVFRDKAAQFLSTKVTAADQGRILNLLEADRPHVRIAGLRLLVPAEVPEADERLIQALSDLSPAVAYEATRLLAQRGDEGMVKRLNAMARDGGARERSYAVLAMVEIARALGTNPFELETVAELTGRRGILHPERFPRGVAAVGLGFGALDSRDPNVAVLLDSRVIDTIINTLGGAHFRDFGSFSPSAFAALRRLSGKNLPDTAVAWAKWWGEVRGSFRARRPLQKLDPADVPQAYVTFEAIESTGRRLRGSFVADGGADRKGAFLLKRRVFEGLVAFLEGEGLFDGEERGGTLASEHVAVTLGVMNQRKRMSVSAEVVGGSETEKRELRQKYDRIKMRMDALIAANVWQRYRDADRWPDHNAWWKANVDPLMQASPGERRAMLQSAIVYSFDNLENDVARAEALARLQEMKAELTGAEVRQLVTQLTTSDSFGSMESDGLMWVIAQGHGEAREEMVEAVAVRSEPEAQNILAGLLLDGGVERIRKAFADERPNVRAAASHAARLYVESDDVRQLDPESRVRAYGRLRPGLEVLSVDEDPTVSVRALLALAYLGEPGIVRKLEALYRGGNFNVKLEVTRALGYVPDRSAHQLLTRVMAEERTDGKSGALRAAALEAMARTNHKDAVRLLRYYLLNDSDDRVQEAAGRTLVELGTDEARFAIIEHLTGGEPDPVRRARLVDVLGRFDSPIVPSLLRKYLGDRDSRVQASAALRAADHNMAEAFPFLLRLLRKGEGVKRERAREALEVLTSVRFGETGYTALAQEYEEWYEDPRVKGMTDRHWFREALKRKGYDVGPLASYLAEEQDLSAVPMLTRALRDKDSIIRRNAAVALERLTGRSFGDVGREMSLKDAQAIADQWAGWLLRLRSGARKSGK